VDKETIEMIEIADPDDAMVTYPSGDTQARQQAFYVSDPLPWVTPLDVQCPRAERLPRRLSVTLAPVPADHSRVVGVMGEQTLGDHIGDGTQVDDGYRWHDVFHLSNLAILGWSPVIRGLLGTQRRSSADGGPDEDNGRAIAIEEGIVAIAFQYASRRDFLVRPEPIEASLLDAIQYMTRYLEVGRRDRGDWERAIVAGFGAWRAVRRLDGAMLHIDLDTRQLRVCELTDSQRDHHRAIAATLDLGNRVEDRGDATGTVLSLQRDTDVSGRAAPPQ
jgi:hypothetical protein